MHVIMIDSSLHQTGYISAILCCSLIPLQYIFTCPCYVLIYWTIHIFLVSFCCIENWQIIKKTEINKACFLWNIVSTMKHMFIY